MKILFLILTILFVSCSSSNDKSKQDALNNSSKTDTTVSKPTNPNKFRHNLLKSDLYYDIEISKIEIKTVKDAFTRTKEQFGVPQKIDGIKFTFFYKMTNPYDKEMVVPIPDYYFLTSPDLKDLDSKTFDRQCQCYIDNGSTLTLNGKSLESTFDPITGRTYVATFKPKETKEFKVAFDDVRPFDISNLSFIGFSDKENGTVNSVRVGVDFDVKTKQVTATRQFKR